MSCHTSKIAHGDIAPRSKKSLLFFCFKQKTDYICGCGSVITALRKNNNNLNTIEIMANVPANLKYSNDHEWCRVEGDVAVIGITDYAQSQLGDIVFVDVPTVGETIEANEVFGSIEAVKTVSDAFSPVGGEVLEFNEAVEADSSLVNKDPYGEGWLVKIKMSNPAEVDALLDAAAYEALIG